MLKSRQQQLALRIALYILRENGYVAPSKRQALNFIRFRNLVRFPEEELQKRWESDNDAIWENDIAWKRKNLFEDGEIDSPERGKWRLTSAGVAKIEKAKPKWLGLQDPEKRSKLLRDFGYLTDELFEWMIKIAKGESLCINQ